jgi:hypothetical protein
VGLPRLHAGPGAAGKKLAEAARLQARGELTTAEEFDRQEERDANHLEEQLAAQGLILEEQGDLREVPPTVYLWQDQLDAWLLWQQCGTQWLHGFNGPTGLNYPGVEHLMGQLRIPPRKRPKLWAQVRAMERGSLLGWREWRDEQKRD